MSSTTTQKNIPPPYIEKSKPTNMRSRNAVIKQAHLNRKTKEESDDPIQEDITTGKNIPRPQAENSNEEPGGPIQEDIPPVINQVYDNTYEIYDEMYHIEKIEDISKYIDSPVFHFNKAITRDSKYSREEVKNYMYDLIQEIRPPDFELFSKSGGLTKTAVVDEYSAASAYIVHKSLQYTEMYRNGWDLIRAIKDIKYIHKFYPTENEVNIRCYDPLGRAGSQRYTQDIFMLVKRNTLHKNIFILNRIDRYQSNIGNLISYNYIYPKINSMINDSPCFRW